jgi:hypothetical protein
MKWLVSGKLTRINPEETNVMFREIVGGTRWKRVQSLG